MKALILIGSALDCVAPVSGLHRMGFGTAEVGESRSRAGETQSEEGHDRRMDSSDRVDQNAGSVPVQYEHR